MGFLDSFLGNASTVDTATVEKELAPILIADETVEAAFKLFRDMMVFTEKRLILVDKQGMTGKKTEYHSVPYKSISHFSIETAGTFDMDAELKIWISSATEPLINKQFKKDTSIYDIQKILASVCL
ncbi:PH domain-containing protein [Sporosarcina gallistercoris]|uniref:PH domain-containing protein n=1 Tax=Sporosarcina gallistercoris TaxID=2762245 RepID=A0ABR8PK89_9BACL|nr:PH domain-containing protein [Sporosarcina gallistercoris]MBD7908571.1 PH domain-containing protein [Sporosarcina gallistercoris]